MLKRAVRFFVYSNLWVACAVASLTAMSFHFFNQWSWHYIGLTFTSTVAFYGLARWIETPKTDSQPKQHIASWTIRNRNIIIGLSILASSASAVLWFNLESPERWWFAACVLLSGFYTIPSVFNRRSTRYLAGFKLLHIAAIWVMVTVTIPAIMTHQSWTSSLILEHLERFALIIALTIPFDIRDTKTDSTDLVTLPMWLGIHGARNVALVAMAVVVLLQLYPGYHGTSPHWPEVIVYLIGGYLIHRSEEDLPDMYFSFWLEGLPVATVLAVLFFS